MERLGDASMQSCVTLYVTPTGNENFSDLKKVQINNFLEAQNLRLEWSLVTTEQGLLINFSHAGDAKKIENSNFPKEIGINSVTMLPPQKKAVFKRGLLFNDLPDSIPTEDIIAALTRQGIISAEVGKWKSICRLEVYREEDFDELLKNGLNFFGFKFCAALDNDTNRDTSTSKRLNSTLKKDSNFLLQCYRCQGWWHTAENCRYKVRCVRCGGHHNVNVCPTPRSEPLCCHCSGPHSASYKLCPVRLSLVNAVPITMSLTSDHPSTPYRNFN